MIECASRTCAVECAVLIGVQSDHVSDGPHIVPQHDALGLHHEEVRVGCGRKQEKMDRLKKIRFN